MKYLLFFIAVLCFSNGAVSQTSERQNELSVNLLGLFGPSVVEGVLDNRRTKAPFRIGIKYERDLTNHFSLRAGFLVEQYDLLLEGSFHQEGQENYYQVKMGGDYHFRFKFLQPYIALDAYFFQRHIVEEESGGCYFHYSYSEVEVSGFGLLCSPGFKIPIGNRITIGVEGFITAYHESGEITSYPFREAKIKTITTASDFKYQWHPLSAIYIGFNF
jgi:hypothetical protein